jgi:hypothetical protein
MTPEQKANRAATNKKYLEKNKEKRKAYEKKYAEKNKEKIAERHREWVKNNPERQRERTARYHAENPHKAIQRSRVRRNTLANRTPAWADEDAIKAIYLQAAEFRDAGIDCEVDHIYPLQGEWVSGLHCEANLQIISAHENRSKQNRRTHYHEL